MSVVVGEGVTNRVPVSSALATYSTTSGFRWPTSMAPKPMDRSRTWRSSTSVSHAPLAALKAKGCGSQCWKDDATPSGRGTDARAWWAAEPGVDAVNRSHSLAMSASIRCGSSGVEVAGTVRRVAGSFAGYEVAAGWAVSVMSSPKRVNVPLKVARIHPLRHPQWDDQASQIVHLLALRPLNQG